MTYTTCCNCSFSLPVPLP